MGAAFTVAPTAISLMGAPTKASELNNGRMKLTFAPYELQLRHAFNLAKYSRTTTPDVLVQIELDGITGYGEASMPP